MGNAINNTKNKCNKHTKKQPEGYIAWHEWASKMSITMKQVICAECGLYAIWIKK